MKIIDRSVSEGGFSLLEVIIAGAMMAFFAMVMLQSHDLQNRMVVTNEAQMETFTLLAQVQQVISDPVSCSISIGQAFGRVTDLRDLSKKQPAKLPALYRTFKNAAGGFEAVKFVIAGKNISGDILRVNEIYLAPHAVFDGQADLILSIERLKKGVMGGTVTTKRIPINIDLIGPEYANAFDGIMCLNSSAPGSPLGSARQFGAAVQSATKSSIDDSGSAAVSTKNALAKACADTGGTWLPGENRCGSAPTGAEAAATLRTACTASGGLWNASTNQCGVAVAR